MVVSCICVFLRKLKVKLCMWRRLICLCVLRKCVVCVNGGEQSVGGGVLIPVWNENWVLSILVGYVGVGLKIKEVEEDSLIVCIVFWVNKCLGPRVSIMTSFWMSENVSENYYEEENFTLHRVWNCPSTIPREHFCPFSLTIFGFFILFQISLAGFENKGKYMTLL